MIVPIVFSSDDNYAPCLGVAIRSLIDHTSADTNYEIYVIDGGISENHKRLLESMKTENVAIAFVDIQPYIKDLNLTIFSLKAHFTIATYYRFFLPQMFGRFDKILYLDCDITVLKDIKELFNIDIGDHYLGAAFDACVAGGFSTIASLEYVSSVLQIDINRYFNAGILICNITKMVRSNFTQMCLQKLGEITPKFADQCILNAVCQGDITVLPQQWNMQWQIPLAGENYLQIMKSPLNEYYRAAQADPHIIHYAAGEKPWGSPAQPHAEIWWQYARQTPFFKQFYRSASKTKKYYKHILKYHIYKLLLNITFGTLHQRYKYKKAQHKTRMAQHARILQVISGHK